MSGEPVEDALPTLVSEAAENVDGAPETKNSGKRALRRAKRQEIWVSVKERKRAKKEEARAARPKAPEPVLDMSEAAVLARRERTIAKRESFLMAANEGPTIVIDCGFEEDMSSKEKKSLSQQIMFSYGINKRCESPATVFLTSLHGETEANLQKIGGFSEWLAFDATTKCYMDTFRKESLVYLTADSPNVIEELSSDKVYIIGGIVDRNRLKGATYEKAVAQGIATAKLPLDKVVEMGQATRVLTVNHVFQILVDYQTKQDWTQATMSALPARKGAHIKAE
ncbi:RNA (guanine-9-)-methyltransferase domain-containing protein [Achlya hypogyna]|uniref:tRNA (guanine(9)-N(1))-methyltransferase n=1 Tax=Achlya hypogyna TaxID=1202772 RepID=A0A1V9ZIH2_ACHHY|nr:RNA (guanine-9-)-methyltransferase domain-containing protein [Achlya hypogyna]